MKSRNFNHKVSNCLNKSQLWFFDEISQPQFTIISVFWNSPLYQVIFVIFESWVVNVFTTSKNQLLSLHFCCKCGDHLVRFFFVRVQVCDMYPDWNFAGERFFSGFCCCRICLPTELLNWFFSIIYFFLSKNRLELVEKMRRKNVFWNRQWNGADNSALKCQRYRNSFEPRDWIRQPIYCFLLS